MKAIGILGSPRKNGNCALMLDSALKSLSYSGFDTEVIYLQEKNIKHCLGCGTCLAKGKCLIKDDMVEIKEKIKSTNAIILASPVYYFNVSGQMKTFIDRMLSFGHRPTLQGYGGAIVSYAGVGNAENVAKYLIRVMKAWGIIPVDYVVAYGVLPGDVKEESLEKSRELGKKIAKAFHEKISPKTDEEDLMLQKQLLELISNFKNLMIADYEFWKSKGKIK